MTHQSMERWIEACAAADLPVLHASRSFFRDLAEDTRLNMKKVGRALWRDAGLALKVLRMARDLQRQGMKTEITSLEKAVMMLGIERIAAAALDSPAIEERFPPPLQAQLRRLYGRCYHTALLAESWATRRHDISPDEVAMAGLFYNLGGLALWANAGARMMQLIELRSAPGVLPHEAEYVVFGFGIEPFGHALAERWTLPQLVVESMESRYARELRTLGVMLAAQIAHEAGHAWRDRGVGQNVALSAEYLDLEPPEFMEAVNAVSEQFNETCKDYGAEPLIMLDEMRLELAEASQHSTANRLFCLAPRADVLRRSARQLASGPAVVDDERVTIDEALTAMRDGLGLNRAVFARLTPDGQSLIADAQIGTEYEPAFNRFQLPLNGNNLFSVLMKKPTTFWLNETNRSKVWAHIPEAVRGLIGVKGFFAMSAFVNGVPLGLFYADRRSEACDLDAKSFDDFKRLVVLAVKRLERVAAAAPASRSALR